MTGMRTAARPRLDGVRGERKSPRRARRSFSVGGSRSSRDQACAHPIRVGLGDGGAGGERSRRPARWGSGESRSLPGRNPTATRLARIQPARGLVRVSGHEGHDWRCNGHTLHGAPSGSMPGKRQSSRGIQQGAAFEPPLARWCCSTTHILRTVRTPALRAKSIRVIALATPLEMRSGSPGKRSAWVSGSHARARLSRPT